MLHLVNIANIWLSRELLGDTPTIKLLVSQTTRHFSVLGKIKYLNIP